jgi:hypothetical protein
MGCSGGHMENGFKYAKMFQISTAEEYPFTGVTGQCKRQVPG